MIPAGVRLALAAALLAAAATAADAQVFLASRPHPDFRIGPLFVRAAIVPDLGPIAVEILFSVAVPPTRSATALEQDLYLLWPSAVAPDPKTGPPDPALEQELARRGFTVIASGRAPLAAENLYSAEGTAVALPGGAPFATFIREAGPLGLTPPATYVKIPWDPRLVNRVFLIRLRLTTQGLVKPKPGTWVDRTFWGPRHRLSLSFNEVRQRAIFPLYLEHRDRVVHLSEDPAQLLVDFAESDRLKIDELFPQSAKRQISETLDNTETVTLYLDRTDGLTPQVLTVQFGYFSGLQSWAPILIPALFFVLGNVAAVLIRVVAERLSKRWVGRVEFGPRRETPRVRESGVVLDGATLGRITPDVTTYEDVLRVCGREVEESRSLATPDQRTLTYRGRRIVPHRRRVVGWLATVSHWDVEQHEVEIRLDHDTVRDVVARVRRSRLAQPEAG